MIIFKWERSCLNDRENECKTALRSVQGYRYLDKLPQLQRQLLQCLGEPLPPELTVEDCAKMMAWFDQKGTKILAAADNEGIQVSFKRLIDKAATDTKVILPFH